MITSSSPAMRLRHAKAHPCLRPPRNEGSAAGRMTKRYSFQAASPEHSPGPSPQRWHVVDAADQPVGDRGCGADHDDEQDRRLAQTEQQEREREPCDRRHGLQTGDERADRGAQRLEPRHGQADEHADEDGETEADRRLGAGSLRCALSTSRAARGRTRTAEALSSGRAAHRWDASRTTRRPATRTARGRSRRPSATVARQIRTAREIDGRFVCSSRSSLSSPRTWPHRSAGGFEHCGHGGATSRGAARSLGGERGDAAVLEMLRGGQVDVEVRPTVRAGWRAARCDRRGGPLRARCA